MNRNIQLSSDVKPSRFCLDNEQIPTKLLGDHVYLAMDGIVSNFVAHVLFSFLLADRNELCHTSTSLLDGFGLRRCELLEGDYFEPAATIGQHVDGASHSALRNHTIHDRIFQFGGRFDHLIDREDGKRKCRVSPHFVLQLLLPLLFLALRIWDIDGNTKTHGRRYGLNPGRGRSTVIGRESEKPAETRATEQAPKKVTKGSYVLHDHFLSRSAFTFGAILS